MRSTIESRPSSSDKNRRESCGGCRFGSGVRDVIGVVGADSSEAT